MRLLPVMTSRTERGDKQIDAVVVDDEESRVIIIQGKFIAASQVDGEPLREVLAAWVRLQDLPALQKDCNEKLKVKLEAVRKALDEDYRVDFELITTGVLTDAGKADLKAYSDKFEESEFTASLHLVDTDVLQTRLAEAEALELPSLDHTITIDPDKTLMTNLGSSQTILTVLECGRKARHRLRGSYSSKGETEPNGSQKNIQPGVQRTGRGAHASVR